MEIQSCYQIRLIKLGSKLSLIYYSDTYILAKWNITVVGAGSTNTARAADNKGYLKIVHRLLTE